MVKVVAATVASLLGEGREGRGRLLEIASEGCDQSGRTKPRAIDCKSGKAEGHSHCRQGSAGPDRTP